ncbi:MAG: class I SAM-dependent methyltransferase [Anaerolineae bacterium]
MTQDNAEIKRAYDEIYATKGLQNNPGYYSWALGKLKPVAGKTLLDIACGMGDLLFLARQQGLMCFGLDISSVAVQKAQHRVPDAQINQGSAEKLTYADETFDYVTILGSLEHLSDPGAGLLEIRRVLKWWGNALILVPNAYYLPDIIWEVALHGYGPNHKQPAERFAPINEWRAFIESAGLSVKRTFVYNHQWPVTRGDWLWYRQNKRRWLKLLFTPLIPRNLGHSFLYLCVKDPATRGQTFAPPYWPIPPRLVDLG